MPLGGKGRTSSAHPRPPQEVFARRGGAQGQSEIRAGIRFKVDDSFANSAKIDALLQSPKVAQDLAAARGQARKTNAPESTRTLRARTRPLERAALDARRGQWLDRARQAGRHDLDPGGVASSSACSTPRRPVTPARSTRSQAASCRRVRRGDQDRAFRAGRRKGLSLHRAMGRGNRYRRRRGQGDADQRNGPSRAGRGAAAAFHRRNHAEAAVFSAIKINGERAYDLARDGEIVDLARARR